MISADNIRRTSMWGLLALMLPALMVGCTSDEPGLVGTGLPVDMNLPDVQTKVFKDISIYNDLKIIDEEIPFTANEVLYLGADSDRASSILARYDFSAVIDSFATRSAGPMTQEDILDISLRLFRTVAYVESDEEETEKSDKTYRIYELTEPLDADLYPGAEPAYDLNVIGNWSGLNDLVKISLNKLVFLEWIKGTHNGIIIRDEGSADDDLVGYASKELDHFTELENIGEFTIVGPTLTVTFAGDLDLESMTLLPIEDTSTLHAIKDAPATAADGLLMRTHDRRYPAISFDLGGIPSGIMVNRAVLRFGLNPDTSYGPLTSLVLAKLPQDLVLANDSLTLQQLEDSAELLTGQTSVDVTLLNDETGKWIGFDVTRLMQREVNGVLADEPYCLMLASGEDFFNAYAASWSPDFYLSVFDFYGVGDPEYPPILEMIYTPFGGGGK